MEELVHEALEAHNAHLQRHMEAEQLTLDVLLCIEKDFREYYTMYTKEMREQRDIAEKLWVVSQRYMLSQRSDPSCKYPGMYALATEEGLINDFQKWYEKIEISNKELCEAVNTLRDIYLKFKQSTAQLDMTLETPFMLGDAHHKPISFFIELVDDLFKYFHSGFLRLDYYTQLLNPIDQESFDSYRLQLKHSEEFEEYLLEGLTYCKCLQPKVPCIPREKPAKPRNLSKVTIGPPSRSRYRKCIPLLPPLSLQYAIGTRKTGHEVPNMSVVQSRILSHGANRLKSNISNAQPHGSKS